VINKGTAREKKLSRPNIDKKSKFTYSRFVIKYFKFVLAGCTFVLFSTILACNSAPSATTLETSLPTGLQSTALVSGDISVSAKTNNEYAFNVTAAMKDVSVVGTFKTFGGAPNHIEVYIMDDATYKLWIKGHTALILFDSGSLSSGAVNQAITVPGKYYLIFTNYASATISPAQQVTVSFDLKWTY
jgi:hypothetical protein